MKFKIIILVAVVAGFILTLFMLNIIASGGSGSMSAHSIGFMLSRTTFKLHQMLITITIIRI